MKSSVFEHQLQESLSALPGGFTIRIRVLACEPKRHALYPNRASATHVKRLILASLQTDKVSDHAFVSGIEVDEYTLADHKRVVYIAKVDTTAAFSSMRGSLTRRLVEAYLASVAPCSVYVFARPQPQYLFRDSALNPDKRVLSDRGLIRWWRAVLSQCLEAATAAVQESPQKTSSAWWYVPGVESASILERQVGCARDATWTYGFPFDPRARAADVIPRFSDDTKARVLNEHDENQEMTVADLSQILEITEECGSNHLAGFFSVTLPGGDPENAQDATGRDADVFTEFWNAMMDAPFTEANHTAASTQMLEQLWTELQLPEPIVVATSGPAREQQTAVAATRVNSLSSSTIRRKGTGAVATTNDAVVNTLTVKRKDTSTQPPVNTLTPKQKESSTQPSVNTLTVKRKKPSTQPSVNTLTPERKESSTQPSVNTLTVKRKEPNTQPYVNALAPKQQEVSSQPSVNTLVAKRKRPTDEPPAVITTVSTAAPADSSTSRQEPPSPDAKRRRHSPPLCPPVPSDVDPGLANTAESNTEREAALPSSTATARARRSFLGYLRSLFS